MGNRDSRPGIAGRFAALAVLALTVLAGGCKLTIVVPEGGRVVSAGGIECLAGETCEIDIATTSFHHLFSAEPASGYAFAGWGAGQGHLCANGSGACTVSTTNFAGNPTLEALLHGDVEVFLAPRFEAQDGRYDADEWADLLAGLNSTTHRSDAFIFQHVPDAGNCDPGTLSAAAETRFLYTVNLIRKLHYLPPVQYAPTFATQSQESALVQLANNYLTHYPSPGDDCYSAAAAAGAGSSNLSYRSIQSDPAYYPLGWVNDNYNISSLMEAGHRRWVLFPNLGYTSYGQARGYASMKVFGFNMAPAETVSPEVEYVAMPYRVYPWIMVSKGSARTPWSLSMVPPPGVSSNFNHFSGATVSVVNTATGTPLQVHSVHYDNRGYGLANFLSWMVDGWDYDIPYTVTISNVRMRDNSLRTIEYPVEIDYAELQ